MVPHKLHSLSFPHPLSLFLHLLILSIPYNCSHPLSLRRNATSKGWFLLLFTLSSPTRICKSIFRPTTQRNHLATSWRQKSTAFTPCLPDKFPGCFSEHGSGQIMKNNYFRHKVKTKHQFPSKLSRNHWDLLYCNFAETSQAWGKKETMESCSNKGKLQPKWEFWWSQKRKKGVLAAGIRKP